MCSEATRKQTQQPRDSTLTRRSPVSQVRIFQDFRSAL